MSSPAARRQGGFTVIELAVATFVLVLGVLLACDLFAESGRVLAHSVRRARDPWTLIAAELLRNDLRGAIAPVPSAGPGVWSHEPMELDGAGTAVVWALDGSDLVRVPTDGIPRTYLHDVRSFRWRSLTAEAEPGTGATEVWIRYHVSSTYGRQLEGSMPHPDPGEDDDLHLLMVSRGGGAGEW